MDDIYNTTIFRRLPSNRFAIWLWQFAKAAAPASREQLSLTAFCDFSKTFRESSQVMWGRGLSNWLGRFTLASRSNPEISTPAPPLDQAAVADAGKQLTEKQTPRC